MDERNIIKSDFDRIAKLKDKRWNHNRHYHKYLLSHISDNIDTALDVGCGKGEFTYLLARKSKRVVGIDLSEEMIKAARKNNKDGRVSFLVGDVMEDDIGKAKYDCIATIAAAHHLPMKEFLSKMKDALKKDGVFLLLDLYKADTIMDYVVCAAAVPFHILGMLAIDRRIRTSEEERTAWDEHGKHDKYLTLREIKSICDEIMPGAKVKRHFYWRYSIVWEKQR